jgi:hypothetical protein
MNKFLGTAGFTLVAISMAIVFWLMFADAVSRTAEYQECGGYCVPIDPPLRNK